MAQILELPIVAEKGASLATEDRQVVKQAIKDKIKTQDFATWNAIFQQQDVCVEPVLKLDEALDSQLAKDRAWVISVPLKEGSTKSEQQLACPIKFSRSKIRYEFIGKPLGFDSL